MIRGELNQGRKNETRRQKEKKARERERTDTRDEHWSEKKNIMIWGGQE